MFRLNMYQQLNRFLSNRSHLNDNLFNINFLKDVPAAGPNSRHSRFTGVFLWKFHNRTEGLCQRACVMSFLNMRIYAAFCQLSF